MTARLEPTVEKLLLVAVTLRRALVPTDQTPMSFEDALHAVCETAGIHLHPHVVRQLDAKHGDKT